MPIAGIVQCEIGGGLMGLSMHILDTAQGRPGQGIAFALFRLGEDGGREELRRGVTNADGRTEDWLLAQDELRVGRYEMLYRIGDYFRAAGFVLPEPAFIDEVCLRFNIADVTAHYHVPLLVSPFGYTTYRGS